MGAIFAADIGGTSSRFGHFIWDGKRLECAGTTWLKSAEVSSFDELLDDLSATGFSLSPSAASVSVFAIAGPVQNGTYCKPPNIAWDVDLTRPGTKVRAPRTFLINDFLAQAFACRSTIGERAEIVVPGLVDPNGCVGAIGAGTGLGQAVLLPDGRGGFVGAPSEGGHVNVAIETDREREFERFALKRVRTSFFTWDSLVCGAGLSLVHEFLTGEKLAPAEVAASFERSPETAEWFARFYGRVSRNFALQSLCLGGLYIAGGVAAKNPNLVTHESYRSAFHDHTVHRAVLERIPVFLIDDEESGVYGAGLFGLQVLRRRDGV